MGGDIPIASAAAVLLGLVGVLAGEAGLGEESREMLLTLVLPLSRKGSMVTLTELVGASHCEREVRLMAHDVMNELQCLS